MPCYHPKKGFEIGITATGAPKYKIAPWEAKYVYEVDEKQHIWKVSFEDDLPFTKYRRDYLPEYADHLVTSFIPIPCGNCFGCRLDYARDWSARLMHELQMHNPDDCWFLTLTYNDDALLESFDPPELDLRVNRDGTITDTGKLIYPPDRLRLGADHLGEACFYTNLDGRDMQLFWKRVRKDFPDRKLVYFQAGEYGERRGRCHYHAIVYDLPLDPTELHPNGVSELGHLTYRSDYLERKWQHGNVIVGRVTTESCSYVARYTLKKAKEMWENDYTNRVRPFVRMSRNPGIGKTYLESHPEIFEVSRFPIPTQKDKPFMCPHPRYYLKFLKEVDEDRYSEIKFDRAVAGITSYENACKNELPYLDQLRNKELDLLRKTAKMKRKVD